MLAGTGLYARGDVPGSRPPRLRRRGDSCSKMAHLMKMVVTGGAGFIGSNLADALVGRGDEVVVLDRPLTGYAQNVVAPARLVVGDVNDEAAVAGCRRGCGGGVPSCGGAFVGPLGGADQ